MAKKVDGLSKKAAKKWKAKLKEARKSEKKASKKQSEQREAYLKQWKKLKKKIKPFKKAYSSAKKKHKKKKKEYLALLEQWQMLNTPPEATQEIEEVMVEQAPVERALTVEEVVSPSRDDLKKIEGIGPKIEEHLNRAGLLSYIDLATASLDFLKETLHNAGPSYRLHDPTTWPKQATLAAEGQWEALQALQNELKGGRR